MFLSYYVVKDHTSGSIPGLFDDNNDNNQTPEFPRDLILQHIKISTNFICWLFNLIIMGQNSGIELVGMIPLKTNRYAYLSFFVSLSLDGNNVISSNALYLFEFLKKLY